MIKFDSMISDSTPLIDFANLCAASVAYQRVFTKKNQVYFNVSRIYELPGYFSELHQARLVAWRTSVKFPAPRELPAATISSIFDDVSTRTTPA